MSCTDLKWISEYVYLSGTVRTEVRELQFSSVQFMNDHGLTLSPNGNAPFIHTPRVDALR